MARPRPQETEANQVHRLAHRPPHHPRHRCYHPRLIVDNEEWYLLERTHNHYLDNQFGLKEWRGRLSTDRRRAVKGLA